MSHVNSFSFNRRLSGGLVEMEPCAQDNRSQSWSKPQVSMWSHFGAPLKLVESDYVAHFWYVNLFWAANLHPMTMGYRPFNCDTSRTPNHSNSWRGSRFVQQKHGIWKHATSKAELRLSRKDTCAIHRRADCGKIAAKLPAVW